MSQPNSYRDPSKKPLTKEEIGESWHLSQKEGAYRPTSANDAIDSNEGTTGTGGENSQTAQSEAKKPLKMKALPPGTPISGETDQGPMVRGRLVPKKTGSDAKRDDGDSAQEK